MTSTKSVEAISPLRRRMIEDMSVRKFGEKTRHDYIRHVESFARFLGRSPDTATGEDLRRYQVHQTESGVHPPAMNGSVAALRFLFKTTLGRADLATRLARVHYPRRLPRVLSPEDVGRLLEAAPGPGLKYKAALSVAYGAGLRASEVVALTVCDIDSKRMLIRVEQGKGRKCYVEHLRPYVFAKIMLRRQQDANRTARLAPVVYNITFATNHQSALRNPINPGSECQCFVDTSFGKSQRASAFAFISRSTSA
jgi:site-specific recombinase XerD